MLKRLVSVLATWPRPREWAECLAVAAIAFVVMAAFACLGGFWHWQPHSDNWPPRLLSVMVIPALTEEIVFRGPLPTQGESRHAALWYAGGLIVFVLWHVIEAKIFLPGAHLFLTPGFLAAAGALGVACAFMRWRSGSLWPGVVVHGLAVFLWQALLGGPDVRSLL